MTVNFRGYVFQDDGDPVSGATVALLETGTTTQEATTTTDSNGLWYFNEADQDRYDVKITSGNSVRFIRWDDQISLKEIDARNNTGNTTPAATFTNLTNNASNQVAVFSGANSTRADGDEIYLSFILANDNAELTEFARITTEANDVSNGSEDGEIRFDIMKGGTLTTVWTLDSSASGTVGFDLNVDALTIGSGADTDVSLTFDANSADGVITWMEDEDYFKFSDDILMNSTERINFYDTAIYIYSSTDGQLDLVADTEIQIAATTIDINGAVALNGAITGATNITLSGELDAATLDLSSSADIAGDLVLSGGADGALQFTNAGENSIKIPDNQASALIIEQADNAYITFVTTNSSEAITVAKATTFSAGIADAGTIAAGTWNGTAIATSYIAADAITGAKIADDAIDSEHYTDGSIDTAHLAADVITGAKIADDAIDSEHYTDGSIDTAHLAADVVTGAKIADDAIDSEHYTDGSIDNAHIADDAIDSEHYADGSIDNAHIADDAIDSEHYADGSIDNAHIADDAIDSEHYAAASIDFAHIQNVAANSILGRDANSSGVLSEVALATTQILIGDGTGFTPAALSGDATMTNAGVVSLAGAQTNITSVLNASLVVGRDAHNDIDFTTDNTIRFRAGNEDQLTLTDGALTPSTNAIVDLGTDALEFKDAYFDGTVEADAITIGGTNIVSGSVITTLGTISAGVWEGTDVAVAHGGTGASSLTDGGVLLGSGTSAVTAMAVLADSEMIVGDGTTDPVAESGATLRTSIGVGTGDSPQFTDLTLTDDLILNSDGAVISLGAGADFSITHDGSTAAVIDMGGSGGQILNVGHASNDWTVNLLKNKGTHEIQAAADYFISKISGSDPHMFRIMGQEHSIADNTAQDLFKIVTIISQSTMFTAYLDYVVMSDYQETIESGRFLITGGRRWDSGDSVVQIEKVYDDTADARGGGETIAVTLAGTLSGASDAAQTFTFAMTADTQHSNPWNAKWHATVMGGYAAGGSDAAMITAEAV